ncbi:MurR/RpiR family transcriptional regulator [Rhodococcus sp. ABRD24]|uniref:MurR/RpiR family transcriptional regulator n=1 Tax=Rhodococcus sp. ABRD24 TaxID=2507582 RepID=UPI00103A9F37|nr:MurR/RpiR family transcriptional regulator [Rhodococcus sp. ABRD24]QBJ96485.1 MurR/RpiR family transcriptional regulator [Rhodococcus sp. ABRD24]
MADAPSTDPTVAERIRKVRRSLAPAEHKVVAALVDNYPTAGLGSIAELATAAGVSGPTVLRLIGKLGFDGYGAFQAALRQEVQTRLFSPVSIYPPTGTESGEDSPLATSERIYTEGVRTTLQSIDERELDGVVSALTDRNRNVVTIGGRYSTALAAHLAQYLHMLRDGVDYVPPTSAAKLSALIDIDADTVVVVFDYRRYQQTVVDWGVAAVERGAHLITVTDAYLSPLASYADSVLTTSHVGLGPFDSMTHGFMLVEILIALCTQRLGEPARKRLAAFEELQVAEESARQPRKTSAT